MIAVVGANGVGCCGVLVFSSGFAEAAPDMTTSNVGASRDLSSYDDSDVSTITNVALLTHRTYVFKVYHSLLERG